MPLWIPLTLAAAFLQNLRSTLQKHLKRQMGTTGATFVRFGFGLPFALLYLAILHEGFGLAMPAPTQTFLPAVASGALAQIGGTFLLLRLFGLRNFMVGTAYSKTEPVQAALFGLLIIGETISAAGLAAILVGIAGVVLISIGGRAAAGNLSIRDALFSRSAAIGVGSGALFGISAVCFRWASLSLDGGDVAIRAATSLAAATAVQTVVMLAWMILREPAEIRAVAIAWRTSLLVGLAGVLGSIGWFTAMTLERVAYVRALGQVELLFTFASSVLLFRERITRLELAGCLMILAAILALLGSAA
ncbi:EamA family transporter [Mangrovicella endophytica]|uniref:EamA family transporter n=1 Tax=Mangrovicella endophytica TaxID=2066697 RepID=UPI000C9EA4BB|nr:EamA family transporter [Mangrovicella endophytica]